MVIEVSLVFQNTHTIGFLVLPGQYFDQETNLHYNYFRDYDPTTGRYITADPSGVIHHIELMLIRLKYPKLFTGVRTTITTDINLPPVELNPYAYVSNNALRWTDPTGEVIQWLGPAIGIGFICAWQYCNIRVKKYCEFLYPAGGNLYPFGGSPVRDRKRVTCVTERFKLCMTGMLVVDPLGSAASAVGEEIGKITCDECQQ